MTYYIIKFVWKDYRNFVQTTYAGYNYNIYYNWGPSFYCDFNEAEKFDRIFTKSIVVTLRFLLKEKILLFIFPKSLLTQKTWKKFKGE